MKLLLGVYAFFYYVIFFQTPIDPILILEKYGLPTFILLVFGYFHYNQTKRNRDDIMAIFKESNDYLKQLLSETKNNCKFNNKEE